MCCPHKSTYLAISAVFATLHTVPVHADSKITEPFVDGQKITTSNSVANVEVQAQSLGPGVCAVEIGGGGKTIGFLAPPLVYSPWTILFSHTGSVTAELSIDAKCDTGVLAQVRYFRQ
jgi:hypothetical protein